MKSTGALLATLIAMTGCTGGGHHTAGGARHPGAQASTSTSASGFVIEDVTAGAFPKTLSPLVLHGDRELIFRSLGSTNCYFTPRAVERTGERTLKVDLAWPSAHMCLTNLTGHTLRLKLGRPLPAAGDITAVLHFPAVGQVGAYDKSLPLQRT